MTLNHHYMLLVFVKIYSLFEAISDELMPARRILSAAKMNASLW